MIDENCKQILNNALNFVKTNYIYLNAEDRDQPKINNLINLQNMDNIKNDNDGIIIINSLSRTVYDLDWMIGELEESLNEDDEDIINEKQVLYEGIRTEAQRILTSLRACRPNNGGKRKRTNKSKRTNKRKRTNKSRRYKKR